LSTVAAIKNTTVMAIHKMMKRSMFRMGQSS